MDVVLKWNIKCVDEDLTNMMIKRTHNDKLYFDDGMQFHREDGPAIERDNGGYMWFKHGKIHRENGPAVSEKDGYEAWYIDGNLHREDGPAMTDSNGERQWYLKGIPVRCLKYSDNHKKICREICAKCKRNTKDGCVGGLKHCPFKMEQIVCGNIVEPS